MADETTILRRCSGSVPFGIAAHEAPLTDFPRQPSQKDGLGRLCRVHWAAYTRALGKARRTRQAAEAGEAAPEPAAALRPRARPARVPRSTRTIRALPPGPEEG